MFRGRNTRTRSRSPSHAQRGVRSRSRSTARGGGKSVSSNMKSHDENGNMIDHEPIDSFISDLDSLPTEEWRARTLAFESLVDSLPSAPTEDYNSGVTPWYKSPTALRRLYLPISTLLLDARSTVAKHTCQHLAFLIQRVKDAAYPTVDPCKYLLKDLLPSILAIHAQTAKAIKGYAFEAMNLIIPTCRFKSGLPILLERLKKDKSRDVRESCIKYLHLILRYWTRDLNSPIITADGRKKEPYLTNSICVHIGNGVARALMDGAQSVRTEARNTFELFRMKYPDLWNNIVQKQDGVLSKDARLKKSIINAAMKADAEGKKGLVEYNPSSYDEDYSHDGNSVLSGGSKSSVNSWNSNMSFASKASKQSTYSKRSSSRTRGGIRGPPIRKPTNGHAKTNGHQHRPPKSKNLSPTPPQAPFNSISPDRPASIVETDTQDTEDVSPQSNPNTNENIQPDTNTNTKTNEESEIRPSSLLLQERLKSKTNLLMNESKTSNGNIDDSLLSEDDPADRKDENFIVAKQLLSAHKIYIDELMENLRLEMNVIRDFEAVLANSQASNEDGVGGGKGPSEEEILGYFETVYGFLDKSADNGMKLRKEMDRVSRA